MLVLIVRRPCGLFRGFLMYYPTTLASLTAFGSAVALPHNGDLWLTARMLLDGAGALFGLYLLISIGLLLTGQVMRIRRHPSTPARE